MSSTETSPDRAAAAGGPDQGIPRQASIWRRFVCMGYEGFLLVGPALILAFVYAALVGQTDRHPEAAELKRLGLQLLMLGSVWLYFRWGWSMGRVTLPMQTLQLEVVDARTGGPISRSRALARAVLGTVSLFSLLWLLVPLFRADRQTLHDLVTGTRLVHRPRRRPNEI